MELLEQCRLKRYKLVTAESCTGGLIAQLLTEIPGSSDVFDRGFITYSNQAKHEELGVSLEVLKQRGAVSSETAAEMASGVQRKTKAHVSVSVTGIAGPGGGSEKKPVGLVYIGCMQKGGEPIVEEHRFTGDRGEVRMQATDAALALLKKVVGG